MIPGLFAAGAGSGANPPTTAYLDDLAILPVSACSLTRKLISTATQCVRVRRSSDTTETDIGFSGTGLDVAALLAFVGAGNGTVRTLYDQTGNGNHLVNASPTNQPIIVSAGVYLGSMGMVSGPRFTAMDTPTIGTTELQIFSSLEDAGTIVGRIMFETGSSWDSIPALILFYLSSSGVWEMATQNSGASGILGRRFTTSLAGGFKTLRLRWSRTGAVAAAQARLFVDGTEITGAVGLGSTVQTGNFATNPNLNINARASSASPASSRMKSIVVYNADVDAQAADVEAILA